MSIIRLVHIKIDPSETETAERKGCIREAVARANAESSSFIPNGGRRQIVSAA